MASPLLNFIQMFSTALVTTTCILVHELSSELLGQLERSTFGGNSKYYRKSVRACNSVIINFAVNGFKVGEFGKWTKTKYSSEEVDWIINLLLSLPKDTFEASCLKTAKKFGASMNTTQMGHSSTTAN